MLYALAGLLTILHSVDYRYHAFKTLTRTRFFAVQNLTKEEENLAFYEFSFHEIFFFTQDKVVSNTFCTSALSLYTELDSVKELAAMNLSDLTTFIRKIRKDRFSAPDSVAKAIQATVRISYHFPKTIVNSVNQVLVLSIIYMRFLKEQIKSY